MEDLIKNVIEKANEIRKSSKVSDYDIAKLVHVELGKAIYYDNNYSAKLDNKNKETELSVLRKSKMLKENTDKTSNAQICKGMSEIYAEILNKLGIEARAIGVKKKGELEPLSQEEAQHYCTVFKIGKQEYVQDYLMESALVRIKTGEAEMTENMPGISYAENYKERATKSLRETNLSREYLENILGKNISDLSDEKLLNRIFEKLNQLFQDKETKFGFEEAKDFVFLTGKNFMKTIPQITNLVKEGKNECRVACIYEVDKKKYLVRGEGESTDINFPVGEISNSNLEEILKQGYEGRSEKERISLQQSKNISMKEVVKNSLVNGIGTKQLEQLDRYEKALVNERSVEGVTRDE